MRPKFRTLVPAVLALIFVVLLFDLGRLALAPTREASIDAVRIRNAMVAELGRPAETDWTPGAVPAEFNWEQRPPSDFFAQRAAEILPAAAASEPAFQKALRLAHHLRETSRKGPPIQSNSRETYESIVAGKGGYCSDYTESFNALALAAGLKVREWGFSWEDMANGHAFNEVWEPALQKWVFLDSFVSFYVVDAASREPLSALEFRAALLREPDAPQIEVVKIVPERFGFKEVDKLLAWYRRGAPRMFLLLGNNVFSYDANPVIQAAEALPRSVEMLLAIVIGEHPRFLFVPTDSQPRVRDQVERMQWELVWVLVKLVVFVALGLWLLWWALRRWRARGQRLRTA